MKRELLSVTSKMHHMSVHVERPGAKKWKLLLISMKILQIAIQVQT